MVLAAIALISGSIQHPPLRVARRALPRTLSSVAACAGASSTHPRLLLVSSGLTTPTLKESFHRMLSQSSPGNSPKVAMLVTASMCGSGEQSTGKRSPGQLRQRRWADARKKGKELEQVLGVEVECCDCAREDRPELAEPLRSADCIWVAGGNTFYLWHWMKRSGVDKLIQRRVREDGVVYVGQSAGAIVAGESIETAFWKGWDDPGAAPDEDWSDEHNLKGMGLARQTVLFPHYSDEWQTLVEEKQQRAGLVSATGTASDGSHQSRLVCLTDDGVESLVVGDDLVA